MEHSGSYDVIVVGGGLAGLSAAILLAKKNYSVLVLEKEHYPRHKVCGEYISMESKPFLEELGMPLDEMGLPAISRLQVTDTRGNEIIEPLPTGGFGISRYILDGALMKIAVAAGVTVLTRIKVEDIVFGNDLFTIKTGNAAYTAKIACGAWGKRSNMDVKWQRPFIGERNKALTNYIGIKYHVEYSWPGDLIGLHNFKNGYCGISQIEGGKCCLCYLATAADLRSAGNDIKQLEKNVLMKNRVLADIFSNARFLFDAPVAISQISFDRKEQVWDHVLLLGDTAGMITPLCGNGMSMAFRSAKIAAHCIGNYLSGDISRQQMEQQYVHKWRAAFSKRLAIGRMVQANFGKDITTSLFMNFMKLVPPLRKAIVKNAAGEAF